MNITPIGYLLIPLGMLLFLLPRRYLFAATVLSVPFFYTAVMVVGSTPVQPSQWFGSLLALRHVALILLTGRGLQSSPQFWGMVAFLAVGVVSLIMPLLLGGEVMVLAPSGEYTDALVPLQLTSRNITQLVYAIFGVVLFTVLVRDMRTEAALLRVRRLLIWGTVGVIISGITYQLLLLFYGPLAVVPMFYVFDGEQDITTIIGRSVYDRIGILPRMFSLAGEPGYTGLLLLFPLGLVVATVGRHLDGSPNRRSTIGVMLLVLAIILVGSTTGYVAFLLAAAMIVALPLLRERKQHRFRFVKVAANVSIAGALGIVLVVALAPKLLGVSLFDYLTTEHVAKVQAEEGSGVSRMSMTLYAITDVFAKSPLIGVGYGSHKTPSFITFLLANTGLAGLVTFAFFNTWAFLRTLKVYARADDLRLVQLSYGLLIAFVAIVPTMLVAKGGVALIFAWYWLLLAMMEATYFVWRRREREAGRWTRAAPLAYALPPDPAATPRPV